MVTGRLSREKLQGALVRLGTSVEQTLKAMDNEVAVIVDEDGRMCGLVTDGDIRRSFLSGATMQTPVEQIMTRNPITARDEDNLSPTQIMALMFERKIRHLPVVDNDGFPVGLELMRDQYGEDDIAQAVLMAGGKGTRLHPLTIDTPKPLLKVGDRTIIDDVIAGLQSSGVKNIAVSVNHLGDQIKRHLNSNSDDSLHIEYLEEKEALGTAGALSLLDPRPERAFIVMNADLLTEVDYKAFVRFHKSSGNDFSICVRKIQETVPFGVVTLGEDCREVSGIKEKPVHTYLVNAGIYMLEPHIIDLVPRQGFFDMVSLIQATLRQGYKVGAFPILEYWRDIGQHHEMALAKEEWTRRRTNGPETTKEACICTQ